MPQRIETLFFYGKEAFLLTPVLPSLCLAPQDRRLAAQFPGPSRTFWIILAVVLFLAVVGISAGGILGFGPSSAQVRGAGGGRRGPARGAGLGSAQAVLQALS